METKHLIAIVIPVHNRKELTLHCLKQLREIVSDNFRFNVIVVDDGSSDGTEDAIINAYPEVVLLKGNGTLWWAGGVNMGFRYAIDNNYDFVYTLNDDIALTKYTLQKLYKSVTIKHAVYVSIGLDPENDVITSSGFLINGYLKKMRPIMKGVPYKNITPQILSVDALSSMSTLIPIDIIKDVGFYDESRFPHNYSDIDYSIRIKRKLYPLFVDQNSIIYTKGSGSNFHHMLLTMKSSEIFHSFLDIKYGNNVKTLFNSSTVRSNKLCVVPIFLNRLYPFMAWFLLSIFIPKNYLRRILIKTNRI